MNPIRFQTLIRGLKESRFAAIALNPGATLTYLTGFSFHLMERPTVLLLARNGEAAIVLPVLEMGKLAGTGLRGFSFGDNPAERTKAFQDACAYLHLNQGLIGIESTRFRFLEMDYLHSALPNSSFESVDSLLSSLRIRKDNQEVGFMHSAVEIAEQALTDTLPLICPGRTEREIASELTINLMRAGCDTELPFQPIVSSGPNSANPHANPSERPLQPGDLVVIDWGAAYNGYFSDLTRTLAVGEIEPEFQRIYEIVRQANASARAFARPGIPAGKVDEAARVVIAKAGYGKFFTHRVGHGLGMEAHEEPYMFQENEYSLETGNTFTIEPGIYLPGRGGVRIEDDIVITDDGSESLSTFNRTLITVGE